MRVTVSGASDDLVEVDGDIREEFNYLAVPDEKRGALLAFSDGTVLRITYTNIGVWRIVPVAKGSAVLSIEQAPEDDDSNYTDKATLQGNLAWVVFGLEYSTSS